MSLTWALGLLAAIVIVVLAWQAYGPARRRAGQAGATGRGRRSVGAPTAAERTEPSLDAAPTDPPPLVERRPAGPRPTPRLDALIDAIGTLGVDAPVSGELVLAHLPSSRRAGSKPFYVEGLDTETGEWEAPQAGCRYSELQAGVQLANRSGALNEIEYSEFVQKVQAFAEAVGAVPDFPDMLDVVARARELDAFASARDAQLLLTLRSDDVAWSVGYLTQCASRHGFVPGPVPGRLVRPVAEDGAPPVLTIVFDAQAALAEDPQQASVRECQISLDVPQTPASLEPFPAWHDAARQLADEMAASIVDDHGEPITLNAFTTIGRELEQLYAQLDARDLAAGSAAARRLFS
ncbi:MAG: cell division protein FtsZ [Rubrivivax sp.]